MANGDLVNKEYVDNGARTKIILSLKKPQNVLIGTIWLQLPSVQYTWGDVDELGYTFQDVDNLNITWAEADLGGW